jgi:cell division protein FtsW
MQENIQQISNQIKGWLKGDKILWAVIIIISTLSILPVYSASSNLEYIVHSGTTTSHVLKHIFFLLIGLCLMKMVSLVKYQYVGKLSTIALGLMVMLLMITAVTGQKIDGASASRWFKIPFTSIAFQPSTFAFLTLVIYICRFVYHNQVRQMNNWWIVLKLYLPIVVVFLLVAKDNGSTALMIMGVSMLVLLMGGFPIKKLLAFGGVAIAGVSLLVMLALNTNMIGGNRIHTWKSRLETFGKGSQAEDEVSRSKNYQVMQARAAIVHGGVLGQGSGKSALKQSLPQSVSDFIFAIIVEEYGMLGALCLLILYFIMIMRIVMIATKSNNPFATHLCLALALMIFIQLAVNILVAINLIPVTGQPLPLISYGGTSMLVTYLQLGLILSVSARLPTKEEIGHGNSKISKQEIDEIA